MSQEPGGEVKKEPTLKDSFGELRKAHEQWLGNPDLIKEPVLGRKIGELEERISKFLGLDVDQGKGVRDLELRKQGYEPYNTSSAHPQLRFAMDKEPELFTRIFAQGEEPLQAAFITYRDVKDHYDKQNRQPTNQLAWDRVREEYATSLRGVFRALDDQAGILPDQPQQAQDAERARMQAYTQFQQMLLDGRYSNEQLSEAFKTERQASSTHESAEIILRGRRAAEIYGMAKKAGIRLLSIGKMAHDSVMHVPEQQISLPEPKKRDLATLIEELKDRTRASLDSGTPYSEHFREKVAGPVIEKIRSIAMDTLPDEQKPPTVEERNARVGIRVNTATLTSTEQRPFFQQLAATSDAGHVREVLTQHPQFAEHPVRAAIDEEIGIDQDSYQTVYSRGREISDFWAVVYQVDKAYQLKPDDYVLLAAEDAKVQRELLIRDGDREAQRRVWLKDHARKAGLKTVEQNGCLVLAPLSRTEKVAYALAKRFKRT